MLQFEPFLPPQGCGCVALGRSLLFPEPLSSCLLVKMLTVPPCQELQTERDGLRAQGGSALPQMSGPD